MTVNCSPIYSEMEEYEYLPRIARDLVVASLGNNPLAEDFLSSNKST